MTKLSIRLGLTLIPTLAMPGQEIRQPSLERLPEEKTLTQACGKVRSVLEAIGRTDPGISRYKATLAKRVVYGRQARVWDVTVHRQFSGIVDAKTGSILAFFDRKKSEDRHYGRNQGTGKFYNTPQEAKARFLAVASKFSIPANWQLDGFAIKDENYTGSGIRGHIGSRFKDPSGEISATLAISIHDGSVVDFTRRAN